MNRFCVKTCRVLPVFILLLLTGCSEAPIDHSFVGYVEVEWVYVAAPQSGWLVSRSVNTGDVVAVGDVLFALDNDQQLAVVEEAQQRVDQSRAQALDLSTGARLPEINQLQAKLDEAITQLELARIEKDRIMPLVAKNLEPKFRGDTVLSNFNAATARVEAAKQSIKIARQAGRVATQEAAAAAIGVADAATASALWSLGQRTTATRVSGRVESVFHYPGEYVTAGSPVLAIRPADAFKIRFFVPQAELPNLTLGETVRVKADGMATALNATVSFIATTAEYTPPVIYSVGSRDRLVFMVEARIKDNDQLHAGVPVDVSLQ